MLSLAVSVPISDVVSTAAASEVCTGTDCESLPATCTAGSSARAWLSSTPPKGPGSDLCLDSGDGADVRIALVHVGKTGGASLTGMLEYAAARPDALAHLRLLIALSAVSAQ